MLPYNMPAARMRAEAEYRHRYEQDGDPGLDKAAAKMAKAVLGDERYIELQDMHLAGKYGTGIYWMGLERAERFLKRPEFSENIRRPDKGKTTLLWDMTEEDIQAIRSLAAENNGRAIGVIHPRFSLKDTGPGEQAEYDAYLGRIRYIIENSKTPVFVFAEECNGRVLKAAEEITKRLDNKAPVIIVPTTINNPTPAPARTGWQGAKRILKQALEINTVFLCGEYYRADDRRGASGGGCVSAAQTGLQDTSSGDAIAAPVIESAAWPMHSDGIIHRQIRRTACLTPAGHGPPEKKQQIPRNIRKTQHT